MLWEEQPEKEEALFPMRALPALQSAHLQSLSSPTQELEEGRHKLMQNCGKSLLSSHVLERERCFATGIYDAARQMGWLIPEHQTSKG